MNKTDQLKLLRLATELIVDAPNATTPMKRLAWIKKANELLSIKQSDSKQLPDNEHIDMLKSVVSGKYDTERLSDLYFKISDAVYELEDAELLEGNVAKLAHDAITHWANKELKDAV